MNDLPFKAMMLRRALLAAGLSLICAPLWLREGSATRRLPRTLPVSFPFAVHKAGARIETELQITEDRSYQFLIRFMFKSPEERKHVAELVGYSSPRTYRDRDGRVVQETRGIMVRIHLTVHAINRADELELLKDELYETQGNVSYGADSFSRFVTSMRLGPGLYRVTVETLRDVPEFEKIESMFSISWRQL